MFKSLGVLLKSTTARNIHLAFRMVETSRLSVDKVVNVMEDVHQALSPSVETFSIFLEETYPDSLAEAFLGRSHAGIVVRCKDWPIKIAPMCFLPDFTKAKYPLLQTAMTMNKYDGERQAISIRVRMGRAFKVEHQDWARAMLENEFRCEVKIIN